MPVRANSRHASIDCVANGIAVKLWPVSSQEERLPHEVVLKLLGTPLSAVHAY